MNVRSNSSRTMALITTLLIFSAPLTPFLFMSVSAADGEEGRLQAEGNDALRSLALINGWEGDGSASSPIMITDLHLEGNGTAAAISISDTDLHLVLSNVTISNFSKGKGITFLRVSHVLVRNCTFQEGDLAIDLTSCQDILVQDVQFVNDSMAVRMVDTRSSELLRCIGIGNNASVEMFASSQNVLRDNVFDHLPGSLGIRLRSSSENNVQNNTIGGGDVGLELTASRDNVIVDNDIHDLRLGMVLGDLTAGTRLTNNTWVNITEDGLKVLNATNTSMNNNTLIDCSIMIKGDRSAFGSNVIALNNTVNGKPILYLGNMDHPATIKDLTLGQLIVGNVSDLVVSNITVVGGSTGLCLGFCNDLEVQGCILTGLDRGIYARGCMDMDLFGNDYALNLIGTDLYECQSSRSINETHINDSIGILLNQCIDVEIQHANLTHCTNGIMVDGGEDCLISRSQAEDCDIGVLSKGSLHATASQNSLINCSTGVMMEQDHESALRSNSYRSCRIGVHLLDCNASILIGEQNVGGGIAVQVDHSSECLISTCSVDGAKVGIFLNDTHSDRVDGCQLTNLSEEAIMVMEGGSNDITMNHVWNTSKGIKLQRSDDNNIAFNQCHDLEGDGIVLNASVSSLIVGNEVQSCFHGISLIDSEGNELNENILSSCYDGLFLIQSNSNRISYNEQIWNSCYGIDLILSNNNDIRYNNISHNLNFGIGLLGSDHNEIRSNDLSANAGPGVLIQTGELNLLYDNAFFSNNGAGATYQQSHLQAYDYGNGTIWHVQNGTRSFGNYWNDWYAPDFNYDSIVDQPYSMAGKVEANDSFPLTSPDLTVPSKPRNLDGLGRNANVTLNWDRPQRDGYARILNYTVYRAVENGSLDLYAILGNITTFRDDNVTNGANYTYQVSALNLMGEGPHSATLRVTPIGTPWAPRNVTANATAHWVMVRWNAPAYLGGSNNTVYHLLRGPSSGNLTELAVLNELEYNDTQVQNGHRYIYAVEASNEGGTGNRSLEANATVPVIPPFVPTFIQVVLQDDIAIINWTKPNFDGGANITEYHIYRSDNGTVVLLALTNITSFADPGLQYGHHYVYGVAAFNLAGEGPKLNADPITPITVPSAPSGLLATMVGSGDDTVVILEWTGPSFDGGSTLQGYIVLRGLEGEDLLEIARTTDVTFTDEEVVDLIPYHYQVKAFNQVGEGGPSEEVTAKKTRTLFGRVLDSSGALVNNATVTIDGRTAVTDWRGLFTIEVLPGDHVIEIGSDQGSLKREVSVGLDSSYIGDFVVEEASPPLEFLGLFWMWWLLIIGLCVVVPLILLFLRRRG